MDQTILSQFQRTIHKKLTWIHSFWWTLSESCSWSDHIFAAVCLSWKQACCTACSPSVSWGFVRFSPLIVPASSTRAMVLDRHLNSHLPPSSNSRPFPNIQTSALLENLLLSQPEAWVYNTDVAMFQNPGNATCLQDLQPSLTNYALSENQITGPDQPIPLTSNFLPHETVQPTSTPMTSLIPPATLLVPYPVVVLLPVPLPIPIPIPIQIHQSLDSKAFIKTSRTGYMIDKSMQTSPTISCCTSSMAYPIFPHTPTESQDEVLDLSLKATQTKREHLLSASPNSPLDLSLVSSNGRWWHDDMNGQNTQYKGEIHEGNGNNITDSKYEDYNGRIVHSTQTVKAFVSPTETVLAPFCDKRRGFSQDYMINFPMKPDRSQDNGPQDSSSRSFRAYPLCSELQRSVHFKRDWSQKMYGKTYKKQNLTFLPRK